MNAQLIKLLVLFVGIGMMIYAIICYRRGEVSDRTGEVTTREREPGYFYFSVGSMFILGVSLVGLWFWLRPAGRFLYWEYPFTSAQASPVRERCLGKDRCVLVYVAPWCPACEGIKSCLKDAVAQSAGSTHFGIDIVVGSDSPEKLEAKAKEIGEGAYVDKTGEIRRALRVTSFPTFLSIDKSGKISNYFSGTPQPCSLASMKTLLKVQ